MRGSMPPSGQWLPELYRRSPVGWPPAPASGQPLLLARSGSRAAVVAALVEGKSIRTTCRMTGTAKGTVMTLQADAGEACFAYQDENLVDLPPSGSSAMRFGRCLCHLTMRMGRRRFTRLTNAFSKKVANLDHAVALHFMHCNFCRPHNTPGKP